MSNQNTKDLEFLNQLEVKNIIYVGHEENEGLVFGPSLDTRHCAPKFVLLASGTLILFPYSTKHAEAQTIASRTLLKKYDRGVFHGEPMAAGIFHVGETGLPSVLNWRSVTLRLNTPEILKEKISKALENHYQKL